MQIDPDELLVAKEGSVFVHEGREYVIHVGTTVRRGHPILAGREHMFRPFTVDYDLAPRSSVRADQRGARTR